MLEGEIQAMYMCKPGGWGSACASQVGGGLHVQARWVGVCMCIFSSVDIYVCNVHFILCSTYTSHVVPVCVCVY